jgi:hypothetical protein
MSTERPNHIHLNAGVLSDHTFGAGFGSLINCRSVDLGAGHFPHIEAKFAFGIRLDLDRATACDLARALTESVAGLPFLADAVHDAILDGEVS